MRIVDIRETAVRLNSTLASRPKAHAWKSSQRRAAFAST